MKEFDLEQPTKDFTEHLNIEGNNRIVFSGRFGVGKSYFLQKFFERRNELVVNISPVNYAVASNEDIFSLLKSVLLGVLLQRGRIEIKEASQISSYNAVNVIGVQFARKLLGKIAPRL